MVQQSPGQLKELLYESHLPQYKKRRVSYLVGDPRKARKVVLLQMLEVAVVVTVEVEGVTVVREEEMVTVVREEEVVGWHSQRSNFFGVQHKILVIVLH
ncbi:hypothetical protein Taro_027960 [Colocasia esculenta]|uniref:Uncharacterized protein n=1 Tax=Colocasia esculenta TaxID=4460 RepID=A0A843VSV9_COLES|nr:hypothetical protein [Colocasia esculenta]